MSMVNKKFQALSFSSPDTLFIGPVATETTDRRKMPSIKER